MESDQKVTEAPWSMLLPMWMLIFLSIYFGINGTLITEIAISGANVLLGSMQ